MTPNVLSEKLLLAVKTESPHQEIVQSLDDLVFPEFIKALSNDSTKKAFWINIYNAFFQILRKVKQVDKSEIYTTKQIHIARIAFSLDDVEHGILRKYRYKYSLGYLPNIFAAKHIKNLAVSKIDYRIHFALNCGAESCPPIAFYSLEKIDTQLEMASLSFLESETDIDHSKKEIHISKLFQWFIADFGGKKGIRNILKEKLEINSSSYKLIYKEYSWEEALDNYADESFV